MDPLERLCHPGARGREIRTHYRARLRTARSAVQANSEGFEPIVYALEELGRFLAPSQISMAGYLTGLLGLVQREASRHAEVFEHQYFVLRQSRNDRMHVGAHARDAAGIGVELALILEEALSIGWKDLALADLMTPDVVTARSWSSLDAVRHLMLRHAFSVIPASVDEQWYLLSDRWLARQVAGKGRDERRLILDRTVAQAVKSTPPPACAKLYNGSDRLGDIADGLDDGVVLVGVDGDQGPLAGIVSPADLL